MLLKGEIQDADLRELVYLMGRTIRLPATLEDKRRSLLNGLLPLTGSDNWIWQLNQGADQELLTVSKSADSCIFPTEDPFPAGNPYAFQIRPNCIIGERRFSTGETGRIAFLRKTSTQAYGQREKLFIRMVLEEIPLLYRPVWNRGESPGNGLPQRQKDVLVHLSQGLTRKETASRMGISAHTVSGYAKVLFATYGVHSQAELMNLFYKGTITIRQ